jgi:hypothetical protein
MSPARDRLPRPAAVPFFLIAESAGARSAIKESQRQRRNRSARPEEPAPRRAAEFPLQGILQGISRFRPDSRKNQPEKANYSRRFRRNSLRGRAGNFFGRAGNRNSLLGQKQGYLAPEAPLRELCSLRREDRNIGDRTPAAGRSAAEMAVMTREPRASRTRRNSRGSARRPIPMRCPRRNAMPHRRDADPNRMPSEIRDGAGRADRPVWG